MRESRRHLLGIFLILVGTLLLLDRLVFLTFNWPRLLWLVSGVFGAVIAVDGFNRKLQARVYWGSFLFFVAVMFSLRAWRLVDRIDGYWLGAILLACGLSFIVLFVADPRNVAVLFPALIFGGSGAVLLLVGWEYLDWWDVRDYVEVFWPMLIILLGVAIVVRRKLPTGST